MTAHVPQVLGWVGMMLVLAAYWRRTTLPARWYALMNLAGSLCIAVPCIEAGTWPVLALQLAWGAIAVRDLIATTRPTGSAMSQAGPPAASQPGDAEPTADDRIGPQPPAD